MTLTNSIVAKLAVAFVAVAMAFAFVAPTAKAADVSSMSLEELIALVNQLQAQLAGGSSSTSGSCSYTWTRSLSSGSTGQDVMNLQKFLNMSADTQVAASGAGSAGMETSYYGPATAAAVSKFQTKYSASILVPVGLVNPTGYFGPSTMAKANSLCSGMTGGSTGGSNSSSSGLEGGAGSIADVDYVSKLSNEEVGEGDDDVEVAGLEIEADDSSDIELTAVNLNFSQGTADRDFDKYATEVSVWFDGEEVARVDADEFSDDDNYDKTISLDNGAIIRAGDTGSLTVAVSGISNLDSGDATETWTLEFESVRFRDAQNAVVTDTSTGDINDGTGRTFSFEDFANAADLEVKFKSGDSDINDAQTVAVDDNDDTNGVELFSFEIQVKGNSDINIDDWVINATSSGAGVGEIVNSLELVIDGEVVGSETVSSTTATSRSITFDNLDYDIDAGDTIEVVVRGDVNDLDGGFTAGDSIYLGVNPDQSGWDIEDEEGNDVAASDKTGSAEGEAHSFYAEGVQIDANTLTVGTKDTNGDTAGGEQGTFSLKFDVTAFDGDMYIPMGATTATTSVTSNKGVAYGIEDSNGDPINLNGVGYASTTAVVSSTADTSGSYFVVRDGDTETFTLQITLTPASDGFYRALVDGVNFNVDAAGAADTHQDALPREDFESDYVDLDA